MKKLFLGMCALVGFTFTACDNESSVLSIENLDRNVVTKTVEVDEFEGLSLIQDGDTKALKFKDLESFQYIKNKINEMNTSERFSFYEKHGFESIEYLLDKADKELNVIFETSSSIEDFNVQYAEYKRKYNKTFFFNEKDETDRSVYSKVIDLDDEFIANKNSIYYIGDSVVKVNEYESYNTYKVSVRSVDKSTYETGINHGWSQNDDRKVGVYTTMNEYGIIFVRFTAQKKTIFGWKRYDTMYNLDITLKGNPGIFEFYETSYFGYNKDVYVDKNDQKIYPRTKELSGNVTVNFGRITNVPSPVAGYGCVGTLEIWSRGISYENRGFATVGMRSAKN